MVEELLDDVYPPISEARSETKKKLWEDTRRIVEQHWKAIEALAQALWSKPWMSRMSLPATDMTWSEDTREKCMSAKEVAEVLKEFGLVPIIRADAEGSYSRPSF